MTKEDEKIKMYFPNTLPKGRVPDREYFFNIVNTFQPQYVTRLSGTQIISGTPFQMNPKPEKPSKSQTNGGPPSTHHRSSPVSNFLYCNKLILFYSMCRVKGKNIASVETKLKARTLTAEETQD